MNIDTAPDADKVYDTFGFVAAHGRRDIEMRTRPGAAYIPSYLRESHTMKNHRKTSAVIGFALALLLPFAVHAAGDQTANGNLVPKALGFVQAWAKGNVNALEADLTNQMKQATPPTNFGKLWQKMISRFGAFQGTGKTKTVVKNGLTTVIVEADFKKQALGFALTFDAAQKITLFRLVSPP